MGKNDINPTNLRLPPDLKDRLNSEAKKKNISFSELCRQYLDKGLSVDGYKNDMDMISDITEQALKNVLTPNIERIVKLIIKLGKITGAGYYLQLANILNAKDRTGIETTMDIVHNTNRLAIEYMHQKDSNVDTFLLNNKELANNALKIKNPSYGYTANDDEE